MTNLGFIIPAPDSIIRGQAPAGISIYHKKRDSRLRGNDNLSVLQMGTSQDL